MAYNIPRGNLAAYYPETNPLVPLSAVSLRARTPTSKSIQVMLVPHVVPGRTVSKSEALTVAG